MEIKTCKFTRSQSLNAPYTFLIFRLNVGVSGDLINTPKNLALMKGSTARLSCESSDYSHSIQWFHVKYGTNVTTKLCNGLKLTTKHNSRMDVNKNTRGKSELVIENIQLNDSGEYICEESGTLHHASSNVVVLGKQFLKLLMFQ